MSDKTKKMELADHTANLEFEIDKLKRENKPVEFVTFLGRVQSIASTAILNFDSLSEIDVKDLERLLVLSDTVLYPSNKDSLSTSSDELYSILERMETSFSDKKFLLGENTQKTTTMY